VGRDEEAPKKRHRPVAPDRHAGAVRRLAPAGTRGRRGPATESAERATAINEGMNLRRQNKFF